MMSSKYSSDEGFIMEYEPMLKQPELLAGLGDLLEDPDPVVVKRIIRVFANVYRHAISTLATGELDEPTFSSAWPSVKGVAEQLMSMLATAENEGVIIHIVRFLEAALVAHLVSDVSAYPEIASQGLSLVTKGVDCLTNLLTTPYVGGSAFIVAMRAIITVACYKPDIREDVIVLIEKQIASPPPTLFDHNVRSLNKILQRNLFRLLRRATSTSLRGHLVEMMVTVGVPRRLLHQWAPVQEGRKRVAQVPNNEDIISGRNTPPRKKPKHDNSSDEEGRTTPPNDPRELKDPRLSRESREVDDLKVPKDPRASGQLEESAKPMSPASESPPPPSSPPLQPTPPPELSLPHDVQPSANEKSPSKPNSPHSSGRSTPVGDKEKSGMSIKNTANSNFEFLKNLITSTKESTAAKPFLQKCTVKERSLYERLDHPRVVEVVLYCLESVPDSPPDDLLTQLGYSGGDVNGIREHLTRTLAPHITEEFINSLTPPHESSSVPATNPANLSRPSSTSSASTAFSFRSSPPLSNHREPSPPSPPSSSRSTPTDPHQVCVSDVDLRKYLDRGFNNAGDVDMRTGDPRRSFRDPRSSKVDPANSRNDPRMISRNSLGDPRLSSSESKTTTVDPRVSKVHPKTSEAEQRPPLIAHSSIIDPRITMSEPPNRPPIPNGNNGRGGLMDHSLPPPFSDVIRDPRMSVPPPNLIMNNDRNFNSDRNFSNDRNFRNDRSFVGMDPRMGMQNRSFDPNFGGKFGMHCGMNYPDPRMANGMSNMNFGKGPMGNVPVNLNNRMGPMNGNEQRFGGGPGIFGPGPNLPMNNGPWQNMPMHNNGQGLFSHAPPMHL